MDANRILPLMSQEDIAQQAAVTEWWQTLDRQEIFMLNKLLLGGFRVGVSQSLVVRALAQVSGHPTATLAHRLMGTWEPTAQQYQQLVGETHANDEISRPYPFYLASPLEQEISALGPITDWLIEWKWDGIRSQLIKRHGNFFIWSRGEELITDRFPELNAWADSFPDGTVIDGEILAFRDALPLPFAVLQKRIGRKKLSPAILAEAPVAVIAYDLLEENGEDIRTLPLIERRQHLDILLNSLHGPFQLSAGVTVQSWESATTLREESRSRNVEGFILKRLTSPYQVGRKRGDWWKWKIDPFTVDAVLINAQAGSGRRANLYTDYTFAVKNGDQQLVPIAKAYSGLSDQEINKLDHWIRRNTLDRFGPVRVVEPFHVFELGFEGIAASTRHKSGIALRFPRILRWRTDKTKDEADTLETLQKMLDFPS